MRASKRRRLRSWMTGVRSVKVSLDAVLQQRPASRQPLRSDRWIEFCNTDVVERLVDHDVFDNELWNARGCHNIDVIIDVTCMHGGGNGMRRCQKHKPQGSRLSCQSLRTLRPACRYVKLGSKQRCKLTRLCIAWREVDDLSMTRTRLMYMYISLYSGRSTCVLFYIIDISCLCYLNRYMFGTCLKASCHKFVQLQVHTSN